MRSDMRIAVSLLLALILTRPSSAAPDEPNLARQITSIPAGTKIEVRLRDKQKVRGTRGAVSAETFALLEDGTAERQIALIDVVSVRRIDKSHTKRNVLIVVAVAVAAVVIAGVVLFENRGPYVKL